MENNKKNRKVNIGLQKVKGLYVVPVFLVGLVSCFFSLIVGGVICIFAIGSFIYYKNSPTNQSTINYNLGVSSLLKGNREVAKNFFNNAVKLNRQNHEAFLALGSIFYREQEYGKAILNFKNGKFENAKNDGLKYAVAECYYGLKEFEKSKDLVEEIKAEDTYIVSLKNHLLGKTYFKEENYEEAVTLLETVNIEILDKTEKMRNKYYKAISYLKLGNEEKGKPIIEDLIKIDRYYRDVEVYGKELNII